MFVQFAEVQLHRFLHRVEPIQSVHRVSACMHILRNLSSSVYSAQLIAPGQGSLVYKYKTEVKLSVANAQFDLKNEITADVHIRSLGDCNYAVQVSQIILHALAQEKLVQLRNIKITETKDEDETPVTSTASAQRELESVCARFRWVDGFVVAVEADSSAKVDHVNFIKGVLSALQVYSPVPNDHENLVSSNIDGN